MFVQNSQTDHLMPLFDSKRAQSVRKSRILLEKRAALHVRNTDCLLNKEISKYKGGRGGGQLYSQTPFYSPFDTPKSDQHQLFSF